MSTIKLAIDLYHIFVSASDRARDSNRSKDLNRALNHTIDFARSVDSRRTRNNVTFSHDLVRASEKVFERALDVDRYHRILHNLADDSATVKERALDYFAFYRAFENRTRASDSPVVQAVAKAFEETLHKASADASSSILGRSFALELYFDLFTLQERIAGRSPAFEGIRIVKERVKT